MHRHFYAHTLLPSDGILQEKECVPCSLRTGLLVHGQSFFIGNLCSLTKWNIHIEYSMFFSIRYSRTGWEGWSRSGTVRGKRLIEGKWDYFILWILVDTCALQASSKCLSWRSVGVNVLRITASKSYAFVIFTPRPDHSYVSCRRAMLRTRHHWQVFRTSRLHLSTCYVLAP